MAYTQLRERVCALRKGGASIAAISLQLRASKSTVSYWCRDIHLSNKQIQRLAKLQRDAGAVGRLHAAESKRAARLEAVRVERKRGSQMVGDLDQRDLLILGFALYWAEGYKSGNEECGLTNSDPNMIRAFMLWLRRVHRVPVSDLIARVSINDVHRKRTEAVERYWSKVTGLPRSQFTKTSLIRTRSQKIYADPENHFGTLRVKVRRGTALRRRILGSIEEIARQIHPTK